MTTHPLPDEAPFPLLTDTSNIWALVAFVFHMLHINILLILSTSCFAVCGHHLSPRIAIVLSLPLGGFENTMDPYSSSLHTSHCIDGTFLLCYIRLPLCAGLLGTKLCAGRVWSISTLHVRPDHADRRPNPNPLGGSRSAGAVTRLRWRFSKKSRAADRPALTSKTCFLHNVVRTSPVHNA